MLFWMAVHKYYQIHHIDSKANYKLSLCTFLDVVKEVSLCSERELSIYTNIAKQHHAEQQTTSPPNTPASIPLMPYIKLLPTQLSQHDEYALNDVPDAQHLEMQITDYIL